MIVIYKNMRYNENIKAVKKSDAQCVATSKNEAAIKRSVLTKMAI